tara:strand:- start:126 stop:311 length:186 start_codon:yes stop_codon:yes gene_type:complete
VELKVSQKNIQVNQEQNEQQRKVGSNTLFKLQEMIANVINRFLEWSWQRKANKQFEKKDVR